jgi:predicted DNA-binding transcriptional regulator AlpA
MRAGFLPRFKVGYPLGQSLFSVRVFVRALAVRSPPRRIHRSYRYLPVAAMSGHGCGRITGALCDAGVGPGFLTSTHMSTYFNMVWRKWLNLAAFEEFAIGCRRSCRRVSARRLTFGTNENSPPQQEVREFTKGVVVDSNTGDQWITRQELAERYGLPVKTPAEWASKGTGPRYARFGRHVRYRLSDVVDWEAQQFADAKRTSA